MEKQPGSTNILHLPSEKQQVDHNNETNALRGILARARPKKRQVDPHPKTKDLPMFQAGAMVLADSEPDDSPDAVVEVAPEPFRVNLPAFFRRALPSFIPQFLYSWMPSPTLQRFSAFSLLFILSMPMAVTPANNLVEGEYFEDPIDLAYYGETFVEAETRAEKPISKVAANVTVITEGEIREMHAHSLAEILRRVPGVFVNDDRRPGSTSIITFQGSEDYHVELFVDGMSWNFISDGHAEANNIPVEIIKRIEIIRGPASSAWGSSLGGAIHITTKDVGYGAPRGVLNASFGEGGTSGGRAQIKSAEGDFGGYLFAGHQHSGGERSFNGNSVFGKVAYIPSMNFSTEISAGFSSASNDFGKLDGVGISQKYDNQSGFIRVNSKYKFSNKLTSSTYAYFLSQKPTTEAKSLDSGGVFQDDEYTEETYGVSTKIIWKDRLMAATIGIDYRHEALDRDSEHGATLQSYGAPHFTYVDGQENKLAAYSIATISMGNWAITPGVRIDDSDSGSFISPSIGITYQAGDYLSLRGQAARGFSDPTAIYGSIGGVFISPNEDLEREKVNSYQIGIHTNYLKPFRIGSTVFYHEIKSGFTKIPQGAGPPSYNDLFVNGRDSYRRGIEISVESLPICFVSTAANFSYIEISPKSNAGSEDVIVANVGLKYSNNGVFAGLSGNYIKWDMGEDYGANDETFIWDLIIRQSIGNDINVYCKGYNLFNGKQYSQSIRENPDRWFEAGISYTF